jgi:hypothetical protein
MFGQIWATGRKVRGDVGQKWPNFGNFVWTKMGGFGKIWDLTFMGVIPGPGLARTCLQEVYNQTRHEVFQRTRQTGVEH